MPRPAPTPIASLFIIEEYERAESLGLLVDTAGLEYVPAVQTRQVLDVVAPALIIE